ncbi:MAG: TonB family protein, partial [Acidobacteria bacterium]|nr:TonB family protein [Acidobacteriota bacterium]
APPDVAPLAPLREVPVEEGARPGRLLLVAAAVVLVLAGLLTYFVLGRRNAASPAVPAGTPAAVPGVKAGGPATPAAGAAGGAGVAGQQPAKGAAGAAANQPAAGKVDVQGVVDQEVARRAEELKKKLEEQQKQLQKEIDKTKAGKTETADAAAPSSPNAPAGTAASSAPPAGSGSEAATTRGQQKAATPAAEPRATETAASSAGTAPVAAGSSAAQQEAARERTADAAARPQAETAGSASASRAGAAQGGASGAPGGGVMVPPKLVSTPKPEYPPLARKLGVEGVVVLSVLVDEQGRVEDVQVLERISQDVGINEAAVQVARGARFKSATRNGAPVKMWTRLRIPFKL